MDSRRQLTGTGNLCSIQCSGEPAAPGNDGVFFGNRDLELNVSNRHGRHSLAQDHNRADRNIVLIYELPGGLSEPMRFNHYGSASRDEPIGSIVEQLASLDPFPGDL